MERIVEKLRELCIKSEKYEDEVSSLFQPRENEFRPAFFNYSRNIFVRNIEQARWYQALLISDFPNEHERDKRAAEMPNRIASMLQWSFINILSSFEYAAKCLILYDDRFFLSEEENKKRIYLKDIMKKSFSNGIITRDDLEKWYAIADLRNSIIHNNSISEISKLVRFPGASIKFVTGERFETIPNDILNIDMWMLESIRIWIIDISKRRSKNLGGEADI